MCGTNGSNWSIQILSQQVSERAQPWRWCLSWLQKLPTSETSEAVSLSWHRIEGKATKTATVWVLISAISAPGVPWSQQFWEPLHCCWWWWWCPHDLVNAELHHHCYYGWWISCDITIYPHYWWFTRICEWSQTLPQKIKCFIPCKSSHDILMVHSILYLPHWGLISKVVFTLLMITTYLFIDQHKHFLSKKWWVISQYEGAIWCSTSSFFMVNMPNFWRFSLSRTDLSRDSLWRRMLRFRLSAAGDAQFSETEICCHENVGICMICR